MHIQYNRIVKHMSAVSEVASILELCQLLPNPTWNKLGIHLQKDLGSWVLRAILHNLDKVLNLDWRLNVWKASMYCIPRMILITI